MKPKTRLSKTAQRGYLYLALIVIILLVIIFLPQPTDTPFASSHDSLPIKEVSPAPAYSQPQKSKHHTTKYTTTPYRQSQTSHISSNPKESSEDTVRIKSIVPPAKRKPLIVELNSADTLTLQLLHGIGPTYAKRIVGYRTRLGGFVSLDQLLEVYGFSPELLSHIAPHLTLNTDSIRRIDINTVTLKQLIKHPYIDYYQARDLIAWRDKGHRYNSVDDLRLVQSIDDSTISRLLPYLSFK